MLGTVVAPSLLAARQAARARWPGAVGRRVMRAGAVPVDVLGRALALDGAR